MGVARLALRLVDLLQLPVGPADGVLRAEALDGLRVHVGDDVLRVDLGRPRIRRSGPAEMTGAARGRLERSHRLVDTAPHRLVLPAAPGSDGVAALQL